jgi:hypothetical protein
MKKTAFFMFLIIFLIAGCQNGQNLPQEDKPQEKEIAFGITQQQCNEANGYWNECGSPCAGTGAEMCIQVCEVQCQCGGIAGFGCPEGYKCRLSGKIADEMGVCVKK